jgi:hypothetical protein
MTTSCAERAQGRSAETPQRVRVRVRLVAKSFCLHLSLSQKRLLSQCQQRAIDWQEGGIEEKKKQITVETLLFTVGYTQGAQTPAGRVTSGAGQGCHLGLAFLVRRLWVRGGAVA